MHGLLVTIVILFALQGDAIIDPRLNVARTTLPLLAYFALMWAGSYAIAVAIATFGVTSGQAVGRPGRSHSP